MRAAEQAPIDGALQIDTDELLPHQQLLARGLPLPRRDDRGVFIAVSPSSSGPR
jgi:hypothetical protein